MQKSNSVFPILPNDPKAYIFTNQEFGADPSGKNDNTAALQAAVDKLESEVKNGIIFIPEGTYRFAGTVELWRGIRIIGFGINRPVFTVADSTPGFQGPESKYIFHFRVNKPNVGEELRDAQNTTFYSGIRNIDFRLGSGNGGLVACRFRVAQLSSIEDVDFYMKDNRSAIEMVGNEIERCRFFGGQYGILTGETVAYWPFYLGDCAFFGQLKACISTFKAGMTILRTTFADAPYGVFVPNKEQDNHYVEEFERLYMQDCRMENLSQAGISMNMVRYPQNWLHANKIFCKKVPRFLESFAHQYNRHIGVPHIEPITECYSIEIDMGLRIDVNNEEVDRHFDIRHSIKEENNLPEVSIPDYVPMPIVESWINIKDLGAKGDGQTDDTEVFLKAIEHYKSIYLPQGIYMISQALELKQDTAFLGLHCNMTRLCLKDHAPEFDNDKLPKAMFKIPKNGLNHIAGICFDGGKNTGVIQVEWLGDPSPIMDDCLFTFGSYGIKRKGRDRLYCIYVHDNGAGVFKNIWIPDVLTKNGFYICDTSAPGQIWMISVEHHLEIEVMIENVSNWKIVALQTEENLGSEYAASLRIKDCWDLEIANLFQYRVQAIDISHPNATIIENCKNVTFKGIHCFSIGPTPFTNAAVVNNKLFIKDNEIGTLHVNC